MLALSRIDAPDEVSELIGDYLERSRLLGQRTAELYLALTSSAGGADFEPEPFSDFYRQGLYHGILGQTTHLCQTLRLRLETLPETSRPQAQRALLIEEAIRARLRLFRDLKMTGARIRLHGNYNLRDVLYTGKDFAIIDFEGDPTRHLTERR